MLLLVISIFLCSASAFDPGLLAAKARLDGAVARAKLHALAPPPHHFVHPGALVGAPDPRTIHIHHHHHHAIPGVFGHHHVHQSLHRPHGLHMSQTVVNNIRARNHEAHQRFRRALPQVAAARLAVDPNVRVDLIGTLDNVKDATKDACESKDSPLFHMREAVGSARDVLYSIVRMAPTGLLVPSSYRVSEAQDPLETLGAINPALFKENLVENSETVPISNVIPVAGEEAQDAFTALHIMLRNSFKGARNSAQHVGDTVHNVRRAVLSVPKSALKLVLPYLRAVELQKSGGQGLLKAPNPTTAHMEPQQKFVGAGRLLELLRSVAASENSKERISGALDCTIPKKPNASENYKNFINKIKKDFHDKLENNILISNQ